MAKFVTIGERLSTTAPAVNKAFTERDPEPIIKRAKQQLDAGATYLDVNIGPAENDGEDLMKWAVQLLQSEFDNVPLALDTTNQKAIEAGISVYNRSKGKPIVNSADAGTEFPISTLQQLTMRSVSHFALPVWLHQTMTSV
ncbi:MAG: dihydropteroate synthase [Blautia massiliensis (ex Durand et al. 2017)]